MREFLDLNESLYFHRFDIVIRSKKGAEFKAWAGAVLRNNFLYAADSVAVESHNTKSSLRELINKIPLSESHPLFKEMSNGFPKGYHFAFPSCLQSVNDSLTLKKNEPFTFSLYLVGNFAKYYAHIFKTIQIMCDNGFGHPKSTFLLDSIYECSDAGELHIMVKETTEMSRKLLFPIKFSDFMSIQAHNDETTLCIDFLTPVNLFRKTEKKDRQLSYQDKCNGFPSFYQLIRSAAYRMAKMTILYIHPDNPDIGAAIMDCIEEYIEHATNLTLKSVEIQHITLQNTLKKETENKMPLQGYIGRQVYEGYFNRFFPMLKFMEEIGVGHEVVYGLGRYKVEVRE